MAHDGAPQTFRISGTLYVDIVEAQLKKMPILHRVCPYVRLGFAGVPEDKASYHTKVVTKKRKQPKWGESFVIPVTKDMEARFRVDVCNGVKDKQWIFASVILVFDKLAIEGRTADGWFPLRNNQQDCGRIHMKVRVELDEAFKRELMANPVNLRLEDSDAAEADAHLQRFGRLHLWEVPTNQAHPAAGRMHAHPSPLDAPPDALTEVDGLAEEGVDTTSEAGTEWDEMSLHGFEDYSNDGAVGPDGRPSLSRKPSMQRPVRPSLGGKENGARVGGTPAHNAQAAGVVPISDKARVPGFNLAPMPAQPPVQMQAPQPPQPQQQQQAAQPLHNGSLTAATLRNAAAAQDASGHRRSGSYGTDTSGSNGSGGSQASGSSNDSRGDSPPRSPSQPALPPPFDHPNRKFEFKWQADGDVHGPYTVAEILGWREDGYFVGEALAFIREIPQPSVPTVLPDFVRSDQIAFPPVPQPGPAPPQAQALAAY
eukprot:tig00000605_g2467.t1